MFTHYSYSPNVFYPYCVFLNKVCSANDVLGWRGRIPNHCICECFSFYTCEH